MADFYVSDSFTISACENWTTGNQAWHYPGTFNCAKTWGFSQPVTAEFYGGEFSFIVFSTNLGGHNGDVYIGLYDVGTTAGAIPVANSRLKFLTETGASMAEAVLMNSVERSGQGSLNGGRYLAKPLLLGGVTTPTSSSTGSGVYQIGPHMRFFGSSGFPLSYQYFMQGITV